MVVYRAKFAPTIFAARQIVSHGHIYVNGVKCNIASRRVQCRATSSAWARRPRKWRTRDRRSAEPAEREVPDYVSALDGTEAR
jgi:small subunit ribosomal protein S4